MSRVEPVAAPYPAELQKVLDTIMPPGVPPLTLFTTLARVPRIWDRFRAGSLLDRGPVSLRHRAIVIDRTCARCGCGYEWGVHVAFFAQRVSLKPEQVRATVHGDSSDPVWTDEERLLIRLVDELHDSASLSDETWRALAATFSRKARPNVALQRACRRQPVYNGTPQGIDPTTDQAGPGESRAFGERNYMVAGETDHSRPGRIREIA